VNRARIGEGPRWRESVIEWSSRVSQKRRGGRGTGDVKSTGSYEGSLTMEGIPDHHEPFSFTRRWSRWSWRLLHTPREKPAKVGLTASERGRGDRDVRGSVDPWHRGKKTPTLAQEWANTHKARGHTHTTRHQNRVSWTIRRSVPGVVKTLGPPVKPLEAQTSGGAHAAKVAAA
jgi:hypothetical protein